MNPRRLDADWVRTEALQRRIWDETLAALRTPAGAPFVSPAMPGMTQMFDLAAARRAALEAYIPAAILWALIVYATATAGIMGHGLATGERRHRVASTGLFMLVALAITLIIDLEQPRGGAIRILQEPLDRIAATILLPSPQAAAPRAGPVQPSRPEKSPTRAPG